MDEKNKQESRCYELDDDSSAIEIQMIQDDTDVLNCVCRPNCSLNVTPLVVRRIPSQKKKVSIDAMPTIVTEVVEETNAINHSNCNEPPDHFTQFGNYIANKLRNLENNQTKYAEKLISDVLFEAGMGALNRNHKLLQDTGKISQTQSDSYRRTSVGSQTHRGYSSDSNRKSSDSPQAHSGYLSDSNRKLSDGSQTHSGYISDSNRKASAGSHTHSGYLSDSNRKSSDGPQTYSGYISDSSRSSDGPQTHSGYISDSGRSSDDPQTHSGYISDSNRKASAGSHTHSGYLLDSKKRSSDGPEIHSGYLSDSKKRSSDGPEIHSGYLSDSNRKSCDGPQTHSEYLSDSKNKSSDGPEIHSGYLWDSNRSSDGPHTHRGYLSDSNRRSSGCSQTHRGYLSDSKRRSSDSIAVQNPKLQAEKMAQNSKDRTPSVEMELVGCRVCGRTFVPDRIEYHERVCKSMRKEQRTPYDSVSHRWKGTDNEPAIKWIKSNSEQKPPREQRAESRNKNDLPFPKPAERLEEPIPAVVKPDGRIECPSCKRSFDEAAANRHIPGCCTRTKGRSSR